MIILIYILIIAFNFNAYTPFLVENFSTFNGEYIVYTNECYDVNLNNVKVIDNYNGQIFKTNIQNYKKILSNINKLSSETIVINDVTFLELQNLLKLNVVEKVLVNEEVVLFNCYSKKFKREFEIDNGKMNIQVAIYSNGTTYIGYPILVDY